MVSFWFKYYLRFVRRPVRRFHPLGLAVNSVWIYLGQIQWWMNDWRSNQVLIGNIWFCFVLLCCHPIIRMTWEAPWRSSQGSICCHCISSSISDRVSWCPMTRMSVQRFGFLPLLPLCVFFYFFLSFSEERGRYYPNGLRFDLLFYLFPGYKLPYLLPPFTPESVTSPDGP